MRIFFETVLFGLTISAAATLFADSSALVREGAKAFQDGDFLQASESFEEALRTAPDDQRIAFNRGAALTAAGRFDEATAVLQHTAISGHAAIAARSLDLLAHIAVARAKECMLPKPENATPEQRQDVRQYLQAAERYYMESAGLEPSNETSRQHLERIRSWRHRIETAWNAVDRLQKRQSDMPDRLRWLEDWEGNLAAAVRQALDETDSPKKYQQFYETAKQQQYLTAELTAVEDDLRQAVAEATATDSQGRRQNGTDDAKGSNDPETDWVFQELAQIRDAAQGVETLLAQFQGDRAMSVAEETADRLNRLRIGLSSFEAIVQEAEKKQSVLCEANPAETGRIAGVPKSEADAMTFPLDGQAVSPPSATPNLQPLRGNPQKQVQEQRRIEHWMPLVVYRAQQGLDQDRAMREDGEKDAAMPGDSAEASEARKQSMELAVQYGPEIQTLAGDAARDLHANAPETALPKQQRALALLREILKPLQDQQQQDQQNQDQQNQDQQNQDQQNQDQQDQDRQDPLEQDAGKQRDAAPSKPPEKELTPQERKEELEKAQRLIRQAKRRQQEAREKREQIRALIRQLEPVEKDW